jgi:hypothetical protein
MKYVAIGLAFILILGSLAFALYFMLKGGGDNNSGEGDDAGEQARRKSGRMAKALAVRIGISLTLFLCVLLGWKLGYLHPTGIPVGK